jgi:hypothetical protein
MMISKWLAIGIILLFVGVTIAPTINFNTVKASQDDELVEVTTQACGIQGYEDTTVKLTKEQYQNLEEYLVDFRARLNQTTTREEAIPIFKDAVVELNKYGLLPRGMSVERAQRLVISRCFSQRSDEFYKSVFGGNQNSENFNEYCTVSGKVTRTRSYGAFYPIRLLLSVLGNRIGDFWMVRWAFSEILLDLRSIYFPWYLFSEFSIGEGYWYYQGQHYEYYPSVGWISSTGTNGFINYTGELYGQIREIPTLNLGPVGKEIYYSGIYGFAGLYIRKSNGSELIGSCRLIDIGPSPPEQ